jgi:hypothetical protein
MIETGEDMDKTLVTMSMQDIERAAAAGAFAPAATAR